MHVPPLRARKEDIPELAAYFFQRCARRLQRDPRSLEPAAEQLLLDYHWPGNVRELEHIVTRSSVLCTGDRVTADELRRWLIDAPAEKETAATEGVPVGISLEAMERRLIEATLDHYGGHRARTAKALGIGIRTLSGKLRQYGYAPREKSFMQ